MDALFWLAVYIFTILFKTILRRNDFCDRMIELLTFLFIFNDVKLLFNALNLIFLLAFMFKSCTQTNNLLI